MDSIPPIVRGEFLYRDVLLVDVGGDLKRHPRAPESEIKQLLNGKDQKDQVGHWWEAQLIHYGLPRSKDKNACKVRLNQALAQGKLKSQPSHLADMEASMKKDYAAAYRKAAKSAATPSKGTKRAREEGEESTSSKKTKISVKVGDVSIDIDQSGGTIAKKQTTKKSTASAPAATKPATPKATAPKKATNEGSSVRPMKPKKAQDEVAESRPIKSLATPKTTKQTAQSTPHLSSDNVFQMSATVAKASSPTKQESSTKGRVKKEPNVTGPSSVKKEGAVKKEVFVKKEAGAIKKEIRIKKEVAAANAPQSPHEGYLFDPDAMDTRADMSESHISLTGVYTLSCPQIAEQLPEFADKLRLFISVDSEFGVTWGGFELAMKTGVIKMDDIAIGRTLSFGWRARDSWDNELRFGKNCWGEIEFDGAGNVRGSIHSMFPGADVVFSGRRRPGPLWAGKSTYRFSQEWDEFPREAYGR